MAAGGAGCSDGGLAGGELVVATGAVGEGAAGAGGGSVACGGCPPLAGPVPRMFVGGSTAAGRGREKTWARVRRGGVGVAIGAAVPAAVGLALGVLPE